MNEMTSFGILNWLIVGIYLVGTLFLGVVFSKRVKSDQDYYVGDKSTPWWAIGMSVAATYIGALSLLGAPAWSYETGLSVLLIHVNYPIAVVIVITLFLPFFYNLGVASIFDYLEKRFGLTTRTLMSSIFLFGNIAYSGIMLYTTALVITFITDFDVTLAILLVAAIATAYTWMGGISAVIWTDVAQSFILLLGLAIIFFVLMNVLPSGLLGALSELKASGMTYAFNTSTDLSMVSTIWTGIVAMSIYHVTVYGVNQMMVQRTLAAKTMADAKKAYIFMGYAAFAIFFFLFLLGVLLHNYYQGKVFEDGNKIILEFASVAQIPGLMGLITAAVIAAAMSSLDSSLNSMATVTTIDFYQKFIKKNETAIHYLKASRIFTLFWATFIIIPAILFIGSAGSVLEILSKIGSFLVGAKLSAFFLGFYSKHTNEKGLLTGILIGFLSLFITDQYYNIAWPWYCLIGGAVSMLVAWIVSVLVEGFKSHDHQYTVKGQTEFFRGMGHPEMQDGWYVIPGKIDKASYYLLAYFVFCLVFLFLFDWLI
ncbi:MAG: SSS family solute:Na+ symporter [Candidatus Azotimanducaceae bacterium]|jgi:SSS family solute:Na+ symporter